MEGGPALRTLRAGLVMSLIAAGASAAVEARRTVSIDLSRLERGEAVATALAADLARTPLGIAVTVVGSVPGEGAEVPGEEGRTPGPSFAAVELRHRAAGDREALDRAPIVLRSATTGLERTPGWWIHALLKAGEVTPVRVEVADTRSSWIGQLVERSLRPLGSRRGPQEPAWGGPLVVAQTPVTLDDEAVASWLAAAVRRLDALAGAPVWDSAYLVVDGRVLTRRSLYWIGLACWLGQFVLFRWRARRGSAAADRRGVRWAAALAWAVAPVPSTVLLPLPLLVSGWTVRRPIVALGLLPTGCYLVRWVAALGAGGRPDLQLVPTLLVAGALVLCAMPLMGGRNNGGGDTLKVENTT